MDSQVRYKRLRAKAADTTSLGVAVPSCTQRISSGVGPLQCGLSCDTHALCDLTNTLHDALCPFKASLQPNDIRYNVSVYRIRLLTTHIMTRLQIIARSKASGAAPHVNLMAVSLSPRCLRLWLLAGCLLLLSAFSSVQGSRFAFKLRSRAEVRERHAQRHVTRPCVSFCCCRNAFWRTWMRARPTIR